MGRSGRLLDGERRAGRLPARAHRRVARDQAGRQPGHGHRHPARAGHDRAPALVIGPERRAGGPGRLIRARSPARRPRPRQIRRLDPGDRAGGGGRVEDLAVLAGDGRDGLAEDPQGGRHLGLADRQRRATSGRSGGRTRGPAGRARSRPTGPPRRARGCRTRRRSSGPCPGRR